MKSFPVYVVRTSDNPHLHTNEGCGHQHSTKLQAHNCATNQLRRHPNLAYANIVRVRVHAVTGDPKETVIERLEQWWKLSDDRQPVNAV